MATDTMAQAYQVDIVTIYNASQTSGARNRLRLLGVLSLAVAGVWLWTSHQRVNPWLKQKLILAGFNEIGALLFAAPPDQQMTKEEVDALRKDASAGERRTALLAGVHYVWLGAAYLAGGWLALAGLAALAGRRVSRRLHGQAAVLMILSTLISIGGIWVAIRWGGMPPEADARFYAEIGAVQSSYAWFLLIATRLLR